MQKKKLSPFRVEENNYSQKFIKFLVLYCSSFTINFTIICVPFFYKQQCPPEVSTTVHTPFAPSIPIQQPWHLEWPQEGQECSGSQPLSLTHLWLISVTATLHFCLSNAGQMTFRVHARTWVHVPHCAAHVIPDMGKWGTDKLGKKEAPSQITH